MPWYNPSNDTFNIPGCILLLLFLLAGTPGYPEFDEEFLDVACSDSDCLCGWNEQYSKVKTKYPMKLQQTRPTVPSAGRVSTIGEGKENLH